MYQLIVGADGRVTTVLLTTTLQLALATTSVTVQTANGGASAPGFIKVVDSMNDPATAKARANLPTTSPAATGSVGEPTFWNVRPGE